MGRIEKETELIKNVRGYGTHLSFDLESVKKTNSVQRWLFRSGIHVLKSGPTSLGLRPSLILGCKDAAILRESLIHYHPNFEK